MIKDNIDNIIQSVNKYLVINNVKELDKTTVKSNKKFHTFNCPSCNYNFFMIKIADPDYKIGCRSCNNPKPISLKKLGYKEAEPEKVKTFEDIEKEYQSQIEIFEISQKSRAERRDFAESLSVPFINELTNYLGGTVYFYTPNVVRSFFKILNSPEHIRTQTAYFVAIDEFQLQDDELKKTVKHYKQTMVNILPFKYLQHSIRFNLVDHNIVAEKKASMIQTTFHYYYYDRKRGIYDHITDQLKNHIIENVIKDIVAPDTITRYGTFRKLASEELEAHLTLVKTIDFELFESRPVINFLNGLYNLKTNEFKQHTKEHYTRYQVNVKYNEEDQEPPQSFITALNTWFETQETINEALKILYYMVSDMERSEQIAIILRGDGGDGKGEFAKLCRAIIPADRTSAVRLEELQSSNAHVTANLYGKMLNIADETRKDIMIDDGIFKAVTGGSYLEANFKHKNPFIFKSKALFLILSNHELNTTDTTRGMFRRLKGLVFQQIPINKKKKNFFDEKLLPEIDQIVKYIIEKGGQLYNDFGLVETESDRSIIKETAENNPIYSYWTELLEEIPSSLNSLYSKDNFVSTADHYEKYKTYCKENGYRQPNIKTFGKNTINILERITDRYKFSIEKKQNRVKDPITGQEKIVRGFDLTFDVTKHDILTLQNAKIGQKDDFMLKNIDDLPF